MALVPKLKKTSGLILTPTSAAMFNILSPNFDPLEYKFSDALKNKYFFLYKFCPSENAFISLTWAKS